MYASIIWVFQQKIINQEHKDKRQSQGLSAGTRRNHHRAPDPTEVVGTRLGFGLVS